MTTREQDTVIDHLANTHESVRVTPLENTAVVLVQGWEGDDDTGRATTPLYYLAPDCDQAAEIAALDWLAHRDATATVNLLASRHAARSASAAPERADVRDTIVLSWMSGRQTSVYIRHAAQGDRTLCGIALGGSVPDPPGFDAAFDAEPCYRRACRPST